MPERPVGREEGTAEHTALSEGQGGGQGGEGSGGDDTVVGQACHAVHGDGET